MFITLQFQVFWQFSQQLLLHIPTFSSPPWTNKFWRRKKTRTRRESLSVCQVNKCTCNTLQRSRIKNYKTHCTSSRAMASKKEWNILISYFSDCNLTTAAKFIVINTWRVIIFNLCLDSFSLFSGFWHKHRAYMNPLIFFLPKTLIHAAEDTREQHIQFAGKHEY